MVAKGPSADNQRLIHWNAAYEGRSGTGVSWFQATPATSLELIDFLDVPVDEAVIDIGGGASSLVDHLIQRGFTDLSVLDVSDAALGEARKRLGENVPVSWLREDLFSWQPDKRYALWHDRALFHFLTEEAERTAYVDVLRSGISARGALIMATFAEDGPEYCSGLPVVRYSADGLSAALGTGFEIVAVRREMHTTPAGVLQPFTWIAARARA